MFKWKKSTNKPPLNHSGKASPGKASKAAENSENPDSETQNGITVPEVNNVLDNSPSFGPAPGYPSQRIKTNEFQPLSSPAGRKPVEPPSQRGSSGASPSIQRQLSVNAFDAEVEEALNPDNPVLKAAIDKAKENTDFRPLLQLLLGADVELTRMIVASLRALTKRPEALHRARLASMDGVEPLVTLLASEDPQTAEHAVTTIMNLSLVDAVKGYVFKSPDGLPGIVNLLENGSDVAKENAAATLFLLADCLERQEKIGKNNAIPLLLELLREGTLRGQKDAALALFNLSLNPLCRREIVRDGGVELLLELSQDPAMEEKSVAILANLAKIVEGREEIIEEDGISILVEILDIGTVRSKEDATSVLLLLAQNDDVSAIKIDKEGARGGLIKLAQSGTPRGRRKAQELIELIRKCQSVKEEAEAEK